MRQKCSAPRKINNLPSSQFCIIYREDLFPRLILLTVDTKYGPFLYTNSSRQLLSVIHLSTYFQSIDSRSPLQYSTVFHTNVHLVKSWLYQRIHESVLWQDNVDAVLVWWWLTSSRSDSSPENNKFSSMRASIVLLKYNTLKSLSCEDINVIEQVLFQNSNIHIRINIFINEHKRTQLTTYKHPHTIRDKSPSFCFPITYFSATLWPFVGLF